MERRTAMQHLSTSFNGSIISKRSFTWGNRHKWVSKEKLMNLKIIKDNLKNRSPHYPYMDQKAFTRRFVIHGLRASSHWRNSSSSPNKNKEPNGTRSEDHDHNHPEDWFQRWQLNKAQEYEAFKKKIEEDPYTAIFGASNRLLGWAEYVKSAEQAQVKKQEPVDHSKKESSKTVNIKDRVVSKVDGKDNGNLHSSSSKLNNANEESEYYIDPITLHKVAKNEAQKFSFKETVGKKNEDIKIPVKTFKSSPLANPPSERNNSSNQVNGWLGREGFVGNASSHKSPSENGSVAESKFTMPRMKTALDRQVEESSSDSKKSSLALMSRIQKTTDTSSEISKETHVRQMKATGGASEAASQVEFTARHQALEDKSKGRQELKEESKRDESCHQVEHPKNVGINSPTEPNSAEKALNDIKGRFVHDIYLQDTATESGKVTRSGKGDESLAVDHGAEGDLSPNVGQYANFDRIFKRKAPHAKCSMDAKIHRLVKEKTLEDELRQIYEDRYGVIDSKHRQNDIVGGEGDLDPNVVNLAYPDRWYKRHAPFHTPDLLEGEQKQGGNEQYTMLKEDPSSEILTKNTTATSHSAPATSTKSEHKETTRSNTHTESLQKEISALKRLLTDQHKQLKYHREELLKSRSQSAKDHNKPATATASDSTQREITTLKLLIDHQNTQLKQHRKDLRDSRFPQNPTAKSPHTPGTVQRTEAVFSGRKPGPNKEKRRASRHRRQTLRHVIFTGAVTATLCYCTGVAVEMMKGGAP